MESSSRYRRLPRTKSSGKRTNNDKIEAFSQLLFFPEHIKGPQFIGRLRDTKTAQPLPASNDAFLCRTDLPVSFSEEGTNGPFSTTKTNMNPYHIIILMAIFLVAIAVITLGVVYKHKAVKEEEDYLRDPNAYMLATLDRVKVIKEFIHDAARRTMLFPYGSGLFCPQVRHNRNKLLKNIRLVYGLGKQDDGTLTVLSVPFGEPLPEGYDLETNAGTPVTKYSHEFLEDLTDFILDIYKTNISSNG